MLAFPNCKINIGLRVTSRRPDGFHNIETVFYSLPVYDIVEIISAKKNAFTFSGLPVPGKTEDNIAVKTYYLLQNDFQNLPPVHLHLHKAIPMGAGLGGGSSDAAFTIQLLNEKYNLQLSDNEKINYALQLGSDCAFFLHNQSCYATGKGELLAPVNLDLSGYSFLIIYPGITISTAWAYSEIRPAVAARSLKGLIQLPVNKWRDFIINDFEKPVFKKFPVIAEIKNKLYDAGALYAAMSGSGAAVFGIFPKNKIAALSWKDGYTIFKIP